MQKTHIRNSFIVASIIGFFLIITIIAITIAQGKTFTRDGGIVETSIIRLNTFPDEVEAYVDGQKVKQTERRIEVASEGEVTLRLEKSGYSVWEKTIVLEAGKVKDVYAQLYPEELNFEQVTSSNVDKIGFSQNADYIFYTIINAENPNNNGLWKIKLNKSFLDFGNSSPIQFAKFSGSILENLRKSNYTFKISNNGNGLILNISESNEVYIYDTNGDEERLDLVKEFGYIPDQVNWYRDSSALLIEKGNLLFEYDIESENSNIITFNPNSKAIYGYDSDVVYFFDNNKKSLFKYQNKKITNPEFIKNNTTLQLSKSMKIKKGNSEILVVETDTGLYYLDIENQFVEKISDSSTPLLISNNGQAVIYESNKELFVYSVERTFGSKYYESTINKLNLDKSINSIYFTSNSTNIIGMTSSDAEKSNKELWIMDFDGKNPRKLASEKSISGQISQVTQDGKALYLLLEDETEQNPEATTPKNIYKINLEVK